jgi:hypothetical protein
MRIMKARRHMTHNDLVNEVMLQLASRFPLTSGAIKQRVEGLIDVSFGITWRLPFLIFGDSGIIWRDVLIGSRITSLSVTFPVSSLQELSNIPVMNVFVVMIRQTTQNAPRRSHRGFEQA